MHQPITINPKPAERSVKRVARAVFRLVRSPASKAQSVPSVLARAAGDVREAWRESASPNV